MAIGDAPTRPDRLRQVIRREGDGWLIVFEGRTCQVRDTRGMRCLAHLLLRPHQPIPSLEVEAAVRGEEAAGAACTDDAAARERARVNVTRALSAALRRLEPHLPELVRHLRATLRAGACCSYVPDPRIPARWTSSRDGDHAD